MAIKIPIVTVFDSKGLKSAQYQLNKVSGNFSNLGRNAVIAGAAISAAAVGLTKSVNVASDLGESINAINVSFGKSAQGILEFGQTASTTLGLSQVEFNNAAVRFSGFADKIVGAGNDSSKFIEQITTRAADFASVYNIDVADALERFQSGLAGQTEPLAKFGVNLLDSEVKAYAVRAGIAKLGEELSATQKTQARFGLLMESTSKTAGDFANTSGSLANGMRILKAQVTDVQGEIGQALLPALQRILPAVRALVTQFGEKLKVAVDSIDWNSTISSLVNLLTFFVRNIEVITKLVAVLWTLNTAYNAIKVTSGLVNAALAIISISLGKTAVAAGIATTAMKVLRTAILLSGIGAVLVVLGLVIDGITGASKAAEDGTEPVKKFGYAVKAAGDDADYIGGKFGYATSKIKGFNDEVAKVKPDLTGYMDAGERKQKLDTQFAQSGMTNYMDSLTKNKNTKTGTKDKSYSQTLKEAVKTEKLFTKLTKKRGVSEGLAADLLGGSKGLAKAKKIAKGNTDLADKLQKKFNKTAAGKAEIQARIDRATAQSEADEQAAEAERQARLAREKEALDERERIYKSFSDSVASTFSNIKDSILGAFSLPELGGSSDSIIRNMKKLIDATRNFSRNITQLASLGLSPELLQQVITAGPMAGGRLAEALVAGGAGAIAEISAGFSEFGGLAGQIATTGTNAAFMTPTQQSIYNITVSGGVGSGASIGGAIVEAIKAYERTSGAVWQGA